MFMEKRYDKYDVVLFEGEYSEDKRNGKGKKYIKNSDLKFQSEYFKKRLSEKKKIIMMVTY